ncbi:acyl-CoA dehydrogenase family protein [Streptomyces polygonati]|uniref:Acyl-CoA dehydrogenase family protein n=1 Tax=Streptomyces polygonati TaxID=1617087 RepID=A0ABV8HUR6_9ACTN
MSAVSPNGTGAPVATFLTSLETGRLDWDRLRPFPAQDPVERELGDKLVAEVEGFFADRVDAEALDRTRTIPPALVGDLQERGYLRLRISPELGGLGLSAYNAFRVVAQACAHSVPAGQIVAIQNGVGAAAMLPALPPGPLRDFVSRRIAEGMLSGFGDTDQSGQNNARPTLTATPVDGGYLLQGEKLFTGNGPIADLIAVSATVLDPGGPKVGACFLDTDTPGFSVGTRLEFMGSRGLPNGSLRFEQVFVPAEHVLVDPDGDQLPQLVGLIALIGRIYFTGGPAMAIAKHCLSWSAAFVARRRIDGRELGEYDEIQRIVSATLAEVYAMDSAVRWSLLESDLGDRWFERFAVKNILVRTAWRIVDRTVSLFGGEGFETVASKVRRGAPPVPLERAFRDARGLRIAGNVDFQLDNQLGRMLLSAFHRSAAGPETGTDAGTAPDQGILPDLADDDLSPANLGHLRAVAALITEFHRVCGELVRKRPDLAELFADERTTVLLGRIAGELFTAAAVLSRAAGPEQSPEPSRSPGQGQELADVYCTEARLRLTGLFGRLGADAGPDHAGISRAWLAGDDADRLTHH